MGLGIRIDILSWTCTGGGIGGGGGEVVDVDTTADDDGFNTNGSVYKYLERVFKSQSLTVRITNYVGEEWR